MSPKNTLTAALWLLESFTKSNRGVHLITLLISNSVIHKTNLDASLSMHRHLPVSIQTCLAFSVSSWACPLSSSMSLSILLHLALHRGPSPQNPDQGMGPLRSTLSRAWALSAAPCAGHGKQIFLYTVKQYTVHS